MMAPYRYFLTPHHLQLHIAQSTGKQWIGTGGGEVNIKGEEEEIKMYDEGEWKSFGLLEEEEEVS